MSSQAVPLSVRASDAPRRQVYLFATCVIDLFAPQAGIDAVEVLERLGVDVHFPERQTCCGQPGYTTGFPEEAR
ncbi:(Fe-S)-binding protein, partial [Aeromonas caviae]|nr:(Fe-S)-binding protein [Aeromonas caviae]